ncbi:C-x8-C-x5-C-x3-H type zinc finger protein-like protein [Calycina marina]|uniref:C-x8-C-x5-C-x3-H type zinc finger protein-like protein n=1 Tax=Calycina marina TaxID=1763456 RepID=A0A9P8CAQ7_9HELO|nr:C-x8-C-x5-C-x3-H type zinc finger protein-like protein [Calycina marina]
MASSYHDTFINRFNELLVHREKTDELIKDLIVYSDHIEKSLRVDNEKLRKKLEIATFDLEDARDSRRQFQAQLTSCKQQLINSDSKLDRNPYIQVLMDGDGMLFNADLIKLGVEGGKEAATQLRNSVLEHCESDIENLEVIANVYANLDGLANAMMRDDTMESMEHLRNFAVGFTQGKASFNFIDVGYGKERADSKIRELTRWHLRNQNCKQILLGISHDAGYAPFLDEVVKRDNIDTMTIMEGIKTVRELVATGIKVINFNKIFRSTKLTERITATPNTWAGLASKSPPPGLHSPTVAKTAVAVRKAAAPAQAGVKLNNWNPGPRGLDPVISVNAAVLGEIRRRTASNKLCNNHYLRGPCNSGVDCTYEHKHKITKDEKAAIAFLARLNPCTSGQDCDAEDCIYGHHCPSVNMLGKEPLCNAFSCRFKKEDHPPGTTIKNPRKEKWEQDYNYM